MNGGVKERVGVIAVANVTQTRKETEQKRYTGPDSCSPVRTQQTQHAHKRNTQDSKHTQHTNKRNTPEAAHY
ncbi:hypothetical protein E2C01_085961 [Portunus trituberculatus]|uniref:Uncharacterized protein n=1 Tax=Portunus trituberculatus TaxID=210409 RepID=A0A5B7JF25_PORTR|nr:hypothetical protein [Portunus trituberculatus]